MQRLKVIFIATVVILIVLLALLPLRSKVAEVQLYSLRPEVGRSKAQTPSPRPEVGSSNTSYPVGLIGLVNKSDPKTHCCNILNTPKITLEQLCKADGSIKLGDIAKRAKAEQCTCLDFFYCKLVVVTAISSNHYEEAQGMIASIQKFLPSTKLIVYNLGLSAEQKRKVHQYCNVEVRPFRFEKYPPHTKNLQLYAWKTFIVKEVASEYEVLFWGDSSVRVVGPSFADKVFPFLLKFPFVAGSTTPLPIVSLTHDGMLKYLNMPVSRKQMGHFGHIEANCWVMWANSLMRNKFLTYWVDCGLHQKCIAPDGTSIYYCNFGLSRKNEGAGIYIGCHRYDQSALAMILIREFGVQVWDKVTHNEAKAVFRVQRQSITHQPIKQCS